MPFLHSPAVLRNLPAGHGRPTGVQEPLQPLKQGPVVRSTRSIAKLIDFVRNPVENVGVVVESWYEGTTKEERARQQKRDEARQIWSVRLRDVSVSWHPNSLCQVADRLLYRLQLMRIGKQPQRSWTRLKAITSGSRFLTPQIMTRHSLKPG